MRAAMTRNNSLCLSNQGRVGLCAGVLLALVEVASAQTSPNRTADLQPSPLQQEQAQLCDEDVEDGPQSEEQRTYCQHFRRGIASYNAKQYREAIEELTLAYRIIAAPRILYKIGHAHRRVGELREARQYLSMFLTMDATVLEDQRKKVQVTLRDLEQQIAEEEKKAAVPLRPRWRVGVGAGLNGLGAVLLGFGIPALAVDNACVHNPQIPGAQCLELYQTTSIGRGLVIPGALLMVVGTLTAAWPARKKTEHNAGKSQLLAKKE